MKALIIFLLFFNLLFSKDIIFGVVPQQSPIVLAKKWIPITQQLSKLTGYNIVFKTESSIPKFEEALYNGQYDIAYMNPYHFVIANKKLNYQALVRANKQIQGIIVTSKENKTIDLSKIQDGRFLFPAPKAFAATLLPKYELKKRFNIDIDTVYDVKYVNSHDSVYKGIARNIGKLGGGIVRTYNNLSDIEAKKNIAIVYKTEKYPSHPIAINPKLSKKIKNNITKALCNISPTSLKTLNMKKLIEITNSEYDIVKDLAIKLDIYK